MLNEASNGQKGFEPAMVRINLGDSVHFVAADKGHNVEQIPGMMPDKAQSFSGKIGQDLTVTFDKPGVYGYRCAIHYTMGMVGLVIVGDPVNEEDVRKIPQPRDAKARFDQLFTVLDGQK